MRVYALVQEYVHKQDPLWRITTFWFQLFLLVTSFIDDEIDNKIISLYQDPELCSMQW